MVMTSWEVPVYSSDLEPRELKRIQCGKCTVAWADVQCHRCERQFCHGCETTAHSNVADPAAHTDNAEPCNVCQDCQVAGPDFFCRDCERYQCEACCAAAHNSADNMRAHIWMTTEGAPVALMRYSDWEPNFRKYTKMVRRQRQHLMTQTHEVVKQEAGALPDYLPLSPANDHNDDDDATSEEGDVPSDSNDHTAEEPTPSRESVEIKLERVHLDDRDDSGEAVAPTAAVVAPTAAVVAPAGDAISVEVKTERLDMAAAVEHSTAEVPTAPLPSSPPDESTAVIKTERIEPRPVAKRPSKTNEVVDLTGDDDEDEDAGHNERSPSTTTSTSIVKQEPRAAPLPTSTPTPVLSSSFADEDLIRSAMISEYNTLSQQAVETELARAQLSQRAASGSLQDMLACKQQLDTLKHTFVTLTESRTAIVAKLLFYLHGSDTAEFVRKLQSSMAVDVPDAQAALHRRLRDTQSAIDRQLAELQLTKQQMDEAVTMKAGDAYAEVLRLGNEISAREQQLQTLEAQRLEAFLQLAHVSAAVRRAALAFLEPPAGADEAASAP